MINQDLLIYIKKRLSDDISRGQIVSDLESVGWEEKDIADAFQGHEEKVFVRNSWGKVLMKIIGAIMIIIPIILIGVSVFILITGYHGSSQGHRISDATVQSNLKMVQVQSELAWDYSEAIRGDNSGNYNATCGANNIQQDPIIRTAIKAADDANGDGEVVCGKSSFGDADAYAISAQFDSEEPTSWCIDSTGFAGEITESIKSNDTNCEI